MPRLWTVASTAALTVAFATGGFVRADQAVRLRAEWKDLETWSRPVAETGETERGLGLHLSGPGGAVLASFAVRTPPRGRADRANEVIVQAAASPLANPNRLQTPTLVLVGHTEGERDVRFDLSSRLTVDDPSPGAQVTTGVASMPAADYRRLTAAERITGTILGIEVELRADQVAAMRALLRTSNRMPVSRSETSHRIFRDFRSFDRRPRGIRTGAPWATQRSA